MVFAEHYWLHLGISIHHLYTALSFHLQQVMSGNLNNLSQTQRMQLPGQQEPTEEEPLYVNAKQYHRILKRRQARAKLEAEGKIPRTRKVRKTFSHYHQDRLLRKLLFCITI